MKINIGCQPNCSEYVLTIIPPAKIARASKLSLLLSSFYFDSADREDLTDGVEGIYHTSIRSVNVENNLIVVKGYLNKDGLVEWLTKNGYEFQVDGD